MIHWRLEYQFYWGSSKGKKVFLTLCSSGPSYCGSLRLYVQYVWYLFVWLIKAEASCQSIYYFWRVLWSGTSARKLWRCNSFYLEDFALMLFIKIDSPIWFCLLNGLLKLVLYSFLFPSTGIHLYPPCDISCRSKNTAPAMSAMVASTSPTQPCVVSSDLRSPLAESVCIEIVIVVWSHILCLCTYVCVSGWVTTGSMSLSYHYHLPHLTSLMSVHCHLLSIFGQLSPRLWVSLNALKPLTHVHVSFYPLYSRVP